MTTLTDFLLARIAEVEALARAAKEHAATPWRATYGRQVETSRDGYLVTPEDEHSYTTDPPEDVALHIARHDPARVLAECEAKRAIVEDFEVLHRDYRETHDPSTEARRFQARIAMAHLAAVYADHEDFREEWKP